MSPDAQERSASLCADLAEFDTPTVSNAIEGFTIRDRTEGYASAEIVCQYPDLPPMVGYALTCTVDTTTPGARRPTALAELIDALERAPKPAVIVCQYVGPNPRSGCLAGDMFATLLRRLGAIGIVTDAPNRDVQMIRERAPGFQLFGAGMVASHGNGSIGGVGSTVVVGGLTVRPGDLIHGDVNGVISIPLEIASEVAAAAAQVRVDEQAVFDLMADPSAELEAIKAQFIH
jgi:regulator of RNase E activity RraA